MRTTIACQRSSKIKCKHNGKSPCAGCSKSGNTQTCVLSGPFDGQKKSPRTPARVAKRKRISRGDVKPPTERETHPAQQTASDVDTVKLIFEEVPRDHLAKAMAIFQAQFPEFGFIHPNDLDYQVDDMTAVQMLRLLSILAVSYRYLDTSSPKSGREYASLAASELHKRLTTSPGVNLIQAFLILSLYDWGEGEGFSAWMHAGAAARMALGTLSISPSVGVRRSLSEVEKRTVWTCFIMDKLLSCGKRRQPMFHLETMDFPFPSNDMDFAYGSSHSQGPYAVQALYGIGDYFLLAVRGFHIWSKIHTWVGEGGRRLPGMAEPEQCPWRSTSQWNLMREELLDWRNSYEPQLKYPETKAAVHVHLRQAEKFGYLNLIYYISYLFLCREYIPFAPVGETRPRGPIERPLLKDVGPAEFWVQNAAQLFHCTTQISNILKDLRVAGVPIQTPFTGLCSFSAAILSYYAASFPAFMGFNESQTDFAKEQADQSMSELKRIGEVWRIAEEWINVAETGMSLFNRITSATHGRTVRRSRYDYPELEDSMHLAPLKGMPRPSLVHPVPNPQEATENETAGVHAAGLEANGPSTQADIQENMPLEGLPTIDNEFMDEDSWRLWSFWDDPHLLSTFSDYGGQ